MNTSTAMSTIYSLPWFLFWLQLYNEKVFMFGMYLVRISIYKFNWHSKLHSNSHEEFFYHLYQDNLVKVCFFYPHLSLETVFLPLKLTQIFCINMNIYFLENWQFNHKSVPHLLHTYQAWKTVLKIRQNLKVCGIQKFKFSNSLVNWEKFGSTA